jgi:DNA helicase-2/ATP-dependent DNA helicase PcrA
MLEGWRGQRAESVEAEVVRVLDKSGYRTMLAASRDPDDEDRLANIEELISAANQYDMDHPEDGGVEGFLEQASLVADVDRYDESGDIVTLMTLHSAKGLEFPVVFIAAVEDGLLPHSRSVESDNELEEERRLFFVGMTRAMRELYLTHVQYRMFRGMMERAIPSRFIGELPPEGIAVGHGADSSAASTSSGPSHHDWPADPEPQDDSVIVLKVGMLVRHAEFGMGRIVSIEGSGNKRKATVNFNHAGRKRLMLQYANLEPVLPD